MGEGNSSKKWILWIVSISLVILCAVGAVIVYIDPYFHYHKPLKEYSYPAKDAYYMNDGILRNFDYSAVITGTSMTENFKTSEAEKLFGGTFVKVPFSGASLREVNDRLRRAFDSGKSPEIVIRSLDYYSWSRGKDFQNYDYSEMEYFYNDTVLDDAGYVLNCQLLNKYIIPFLSDPYRDYPVQFDFDSYCSWDFPNGRQAVLSHYTHREEASPETPMTEEDKEKVLANVRQNVSAMTEEHPETVFYYFFPPSSICRWDSFHSEGRCRWMLEAEKLIAEELLQFPNVRLFSFWNNHDLICDLDNYKDPEHYIGDINSSILKWMKEGKYQLTRENYREYYKDAEDFFLNYDYSQFSG